MSCRIEGGDGEVGDDVDCGLFECYSSGTMSVLMLLPSSSSESAPVAVVATTSLFKVSSSALVLMRRHCALNSLRIAERAK